MITTNLEPNLGVLLKVRGYKPSQGAADSATISKQGYETMILFKEDAQKLASPNKLPEQYDKKIDVYKVV